MNIAIDFDGTWTVDPKLWAQFAVSANERGHSVFIVTGRKGWSDDMERANIPSWIRIIYTAGQLKEAFVLRSGLQIDVWIDDMPGMIQDCRVIQPSPDNEL